MTRVTVGRVVTLPERERSAAPASEADHAPGMARVVGERLVNAAEEAKRLLADAQESCRARLAAFERDMDRMRHEMREQLAAELAIEHAGKLLELTALRTRAVQQAQDDIVRLASLLAERVLGEELSLHPERIVELARQLLRETTGAQRITLHVSPEDTEMLLREMELLASIPSSASLEIIADAELGRGDLRVETDLGSIDGRIGTQLAHLASTLVESIRS